VTCVVVSEVRADGKLVRADVAPIGSLPLKSFDSVDDQTSPDAKEANFARR